MKQLLIIGFILFLFAAVAGAAPEVKVVELTPATADTATAITANVSCIGKESLTAFWQVLKNDAVLAQGKAIGLTNDTEKTVHTISVTQTSKGDQFKAIAWCSNSTYTSNSTQVLSNTVTITNSVPVATTATLTPGTAIPTTLFTCQGTATDADSADTLTREYRFVSGATELRAYSTIATYQCSDATCPVGAWINCQFRATDTSAAASNVVTSSAVAISQPTSKITISDLAMGSSTTEKSNPDEDDDPIKTSSTMTVKNDGSNTLTGITLSNVNIPSKYNVTFSTSVIASLAPGESQAVTVTVIVPEDFDAFNPDASDAQADRRFTIGALEASVADGTVFDTNTVTLQTENKLELYRLYVTVEGDENNVDDDETLEDVKPGDTVEIRLVAKNRFSSGQDVGIEDITFTVESDDDLDVDEDQDIADIDATDEDEASIEFTIDSDIDEDTYELVITLQGDDEYGATHGEQWKIELDIAKEDEEISIKSAVLSPETVSCDRTSTLNIRLENTGNDDSDEIVLVAKNEALGISSITRNIDLDDGDELSKTITIKVGDSVATGTYTIAIYSYYDDDAYDDNDISKYSSVDLKVEKCGSTTGGSTTGGTTTGGSTTGGTTTGGTTEEDDEETVVVIDTGNTGGSTTGATARPPAEIRTGFADDSTLILIILGYVIVIGVGILLIASLFRKR